MDNLSDKIIEVCTRLTESGVRFYYSDDVVPFGEITEFDTLENGYLYFTIECECKVKVPVVDFKTYHSKENINLYDWSDMREFDRLIEKIIEVN